jgi:hypothetical protein
VVAGDAPLAVSASASSGLPLYFQSSDETVAQVFGGQVIPVGPGTATIAAVQGGSPVWLTASNGSTPLTVKALVANLSIQPDAGGNTLLTVEGNTNRPYILQATADLGATNWTPVVTISNLPAPTLQFSAPATNAAQFYRLQRPVYSGFGN